MPVTLRLLGGTELLDAQGLSVRAVLAQPKRFALFAYLVADRPPRFHRREALLTRFWPEADETHARGALSQALSFLRRSLGEGIILTRGTEEVGVDFSQVTCDVARFEALVDSGDNLRALARYDGDLLPAFHLDGAPEFEEWLTAERARLRERAARIAKAIARDAEAAGDVSQAVVSARHALLLSPLDESACKRAINALRAAGRPALALAEYETFRKRIKDELGIEPSVELRRMADSLRAPSPAGTD